MRCPSPRRLQAAFPHLTVEDVRLIRRLAAASNDGDLLEQVIEKYGPAPTREYVRRMCSNPYNSATWRITVVLYAMNTIIGTYGIEALGPNVGGPRPPLYEFLNAGDAYTTTLIYTRGTDTLRIGCWGDIAERHPSW